MNPVDLIIFAVIAAVVGIAVWYISRSKKQGRKCIGCPDGAKCSGACSGCSMADSCGGNCKQKKNVTE